MRNPRLLAPRLFAYLKPLKEEHRAICGRLIPDEDGNPTEKRCPGLLGYVKKAGLRRIGNSGFSIPIWTIDHKRGLTIHRDYRRKPVMVPFGEGRFAEVSYQLHVVKGKDAPSRPSTKEKAIPRRVREPSKMPSGPFGTPGLEQMMAGLGQPIVATDPYELPVIVVCPHCQTENWVATPEPTKPIWWAQQTGAERVLPEIPVGSVASASITLVGKADTKSI